MSLYRKLALPALLALIPAMTLSSCVASIKPDESGISEVPTESLIRIGMAKVKITPTEDVYLWGYENRTPNVLCSYPDDILDDIFARILVVEIADKRIIYVHAELCLLEEGRSCSANFRRDIADINDALEDDVILLSAHNHQAQDQLSKEQEAAINEAVGLAVSRLEPAVVGSAIMPNPYGVSRSPSYGIDYDAPYDNIMTVLRFDNAETGLPIGMVYSYPVHNTMLGNGGASSRNLLTCEFTGMATKYIESQLTEEQSPDFVAIHINGATGNAGPLFQGNFNLPYQSIKRAGAELGQFVYECYDRIAADKYYTTAMTLFDVVRLETNQEDMSHKDYFGASRYKELKVYASAFGDVAVVGVSAETFTITGAHLRAESPYRYTLNTGCVNGWLGYIPTRETFESGRVEQECQPWKTPFTAETEQIVYEGVLGILCRLAEVRVKDRILPESAPPILDGEKSNYVFDFNQMVKADKVVLSFEQKSRTDCPADFELSLYDSEGNEVYHQVFLDNSVNYLGVFTDDISFSRAEILVSRTYLDRNPVDGLPITLYALQFEPAPMS